jgi:hypothetical protein
MCEELPGSEDGSRAACLKNYLRMRTALGLHAEDHPNSGSCSSAACLKNYLRVRTTLGLHA